MAAQADSGIDVGDGPTAAARRDPQHPPAIAVVIVAAAAVIGWFLPLFGLSLLAFLVVDLGIWAAKR